MFADREEAGRLLAGRLAAYRGRSGLVVALPRGGVAVARPIAQALGMPLDVLVARKIGAPRSSELAIGAITASGTRVLHTALLRGLWLPPGYLEKASAAEQGVAREREAALRAGRGPLELGGRLVIVVDDGVATGMTLRAALAEIRQARPAEVVVAVPVIAADTAGAIAREVDHLVALELPEAFEAVGQYYRRFDQLSTKEAKALLQTGLPS